MKLGRRTLGLLAAMLLVAATSALGKDLYWTDAGTIYRANPDGSGAKPILSSFADQLAIDTLEGRMYFTGDLPLGAPGPTGRIWSAKLDGSDQRPLAVSWTAPAGIALEPAGILPVVPWMFWADGDSVQRANRLGSGVQTIVPAQTAAFGIAFDPDARKIYWTRHSADTALPAIQRANPDGSNIEKLVLAKGPVSGIALDPLAGKMYWAYVNPDIDGLLAGMIERSNLDGSQVEPVVSGLIDPIGLALDLDAGWIYWTDSGGGTGRGSVDRARLDGSGRETLASNLTDPRGIALDFIVPEPGTLLLAAAASVLLLRRQRGSERVAG